MANRPTAIIRTKIPDNLFEALEIKRREGARKTSRGALMEQAGSEFLEWYQDEREEGWIPRALVAVGSEFRCEISEPLKRELDAVAEREHVMVSTIYYNALDQWARSRELKIVHPSETPYVTIVPLPAQLNIQIATRVARREFETKGSFYECALEFWLDEREIHEERSPREPYPYWAMPRASDDAPHGEHLEDIKLTIPRSLHRYMSMWKTEDSMSIRVIYYNAIARYLESLNEGEPSSP